MYVNMVHTSRILTDSINFRSSKNKNISAIGKTILYHVLRNQRFNIHKTACYLLYIYIARHYIASIFFLRWLERGRRGAQIYSPPTRGNAEYTKINAEEEGSLRRGLKTLGWSREFD